VTVIVVALLKESEADEISTPAVKVMFGGAEVLNSKPAGVFSTNETPEPELKSNLFPSRITMAPSDVQAGETAFAALSAEIPEPPVAAVIVTAAKARPARKTVSATISFVKADATLGLIRGL
jgi:hypothetical protein